MIEIGLPRNPQKLILKILLAAALTGAGLVIQSACDSAPVEETGGTATVEILESPSPTLDQGTIPAGTAPATPVPSFTPLPEITPTPTLAVTPEPSEILLSEPTITVEVVATDNNPATAQPDPTATPYLPLATISILSPAENSRVLSPIYLEAAIVPSDYGNVIIDLTGEDGRLLYRQVQYYKKNSGQRVYLGITIDFEIPSMVEASRLSITIQDTQGRSVAIASTDLVLLTMGTADVFSTEESREPAVFQAPRLNQVISGGTVTVSGMAKPVNDTPFILELINDNGEVVGSRQVAVDASQVGQYMPVQVDIPYTIQSQTWARLTIRQVGSRLPGNAMLTSYLIYLKP